MVVQLSFWYEARIRLTKSNASVESLGHTHILPGLMNRLDFMATPTAFFFDWVQTLWLFIGPKVVEKVAWTRLVRIKLRISNQKPEIICISTPRLEVRVMMD